MQNKSSNLAAFWFIPLVAILLAAFFTFIFLIGKLVYKGVKGPAKSRPVAQVAQAEPVPPIGSGAPVVPFIAPEEMDVNPPLPPEVEVENPAETAAGSADIPPAPAVDTCPATAVPVKITKPKRRRPVTPFEKGLKQCGADGVFPCAWEDNAQGVIKQYWLMSAQGPIQRGIYNMGGDLLSETIATLNGTVTSYTEQDKTYYFEGGVLTKIRTSPYDNCNFHDWFFINAEGKLDVCQCALTTNNCCARSPYKEGTPRGYCDLNPQDRDFCK